MMTFKILPYKQGSKSAKSLAAALGGKVLKREGSGWKPKGFNTVINWGSTEYASLAHISIKEGATVHVLNSPSKISLASNKLKFFEEHKGEGYLPLFWTDKDSIPDDAFPIVCRTILTGHSGAGIILADSRDDLVDALLYVKYVKKTDEYRVHLGRDTSDTTECIAIQRKARSKSVPLEEVNWQIRNHKNGFVFVREGFTAPDSVFVSASAALLRSGLDFGAVDVIWNDYEGKAYVLEINTAPGLEGQTITDYTNFFKGYLS